METCKNRASGQRKGVYVVLAAGFQSWLNLKPTEIVCKFIGLRKSS